MESLVEAAQGFFGGIVDLIKIRKLLMTNARPDQPSVVTPGEKSIMTDLVPKDLCPDVDQFFAELNELILDPVLPHEMWFIKEIRLEEHKDDPTKTTLKVFWDCDKLRRLDPNFPADKTEFCKAWIVITKRAEDRYVCTEQYEPDGSMHISFTVYTQILTQDDGFRVEIWGRDGEGKRCSGAFLAGYADVLYLKPLLFFRMNQRVEVRANVDTPSGKSILTESLSEFYTQEELFDSLIGLRKKECLTSQGEIEYDGDGPEDFSCNGVLEFPLGEGKSFPLKLKRKIALDRENFKMTVWEYLLDELTNTRHLCILTDPVRIELWTVLPSGPRHAGIKEAGLLRLDLMFLCYDADVGKQASSLDDSQENFYF